MSWYDFLGPVGDAIKSGWGSVTHSVNNPYDEQKNAYQDAQFQLQGMGDMERQRQMEGLSQAEAFYGPARERLQAAYGDPNSVTK